MDNVVWSTSWTQDGGVFDQFNNWDRANLLVPNHKGAGSSASKNHSEAEKRRRDRINAHLATLRRLVSNSDKMDKATLLGKVVERVKDLKLEAVELGKVFTNRVELFSEIKDALNSLGLTMVQADMTCLGGRIICNFILCLTNNTSENEVTSIKHSLKILLNRIVSTSSWTMSSNYRIKSKRQRFFCSSSYDTNGCE
ncbi:hypothetical protein CTI12_AA110420 [Artemisia annua]|uniref:BHLH domain-containing protein n=1 Tax=Artemisia annua TaxID=35608 RepID=A0A2U1PUQ8_ARTAN|nr:hypothetical protein CTI12_AA110420 [Artemisia annua]